MKKLFLFAVSALMILGSCTQDEMVNAPLMGEDGKDVIVASIEGQPSTRMTEVEGVLSWEDDETFAVFGDTKETFTISDKITGLFSGTAPTNAKYAVYYPADEHSTITSGVLNINLASEYTSASSLKIPMWGTYEESSILFKHLCAALKVSYNDIPDGYTNLLVEASSPIAGSFSVNLAPTIPDSDDPMASSQPVNSDENPIIAVPSQTSAEHSTEVIVTITPGQEGVFYIPLPVGTYQFLKVSAVKGGGNSISSEEKIVLKEWSNLDIKRKGLYRTTATYVEVANVTKPSDVTSQIETINENSVVNITSQIDATVSQAGYIELPDVNATYNFILTPETDSENPLKFTSDDITDDPVHAKININMPENSEGIFASINTPNYTITLEGGTYESLTATTAENTLIIGESVIVKKLIVKGGNVRIEGGTVAEIENEQGKTITYVVEGAKDFDAIPEGVTEVELAGDITASEMIKLENAITINGNGNTFTSTATKAFEVYANATFKDITINGVDRCVDTRKAVELTLDNVKLYATNSNSSQPLTIGGSEGGTKVTITNSAISAKKYAIITFVKTELTATESTISGYNALYVKPGSDGSVFNFMSSTLDGSMGSYADTQGNSTSTIAIRDNNVIVTVDENSKVTATGNHYYALSLDSTYPNETGPFTGVAVTMNCDVQGNLLDIDNFGGNTICFKEEYKEQLTEMGYLVSEPADGMVTVTGVAEGILNETALQVAIAAGVSEITLDADIVLTKAITIPVGIIATINLNGYDITAPNTDAFEVAGTLTINDEKNEGVVSAGSNRPAASVCAVWANGGIVTINGGHYKVYADQAGKRNDCIYAGYNADNNDTAGNITINGGKFEYVWPDDDNRNYANEYNGDQFLLNCADKDLYETKITVNGGEFKNHVPGYEDVTPAGRTDKEVELGDNKVVKNSTTPQRSSHEKDLGDVWYKVTNTSGVW